jgi:hypothetical protein
VKPRRRRQPLPRVGPKGDDLHSHLTGADYAERDLEWAAACFQRQPWWNGHLELMLTVESSAVTVG